VKSNPDTAMIVIQRVSFPVRRERPLRAHLPVIRGFAAVIDRLWLHWNARGRKGSEIGCPGQISTVTAPGFLDKFHTQVNPLQSGHQRCQLW